MSRKNNINITKMAKRIYERDDNVIVKKEFISMILKMYLEECQKALLRGERVELTGIGTIIPEVKTHRACFLPRCDNDSHEDAPYTRIKIARSHALAHTMDKKLLDNFKNGIYGLEKVQLEIKQFNILKEGGYIPEDVQYVDYINKEDDECTDE